MKGLSGLLLGLWLLSSATQASVVLPAATFNDGLGAGTFDFPCTTESCSYGGPLTISQYFADGKGSLSFSGSNVTPYGTQLSTGGLLTYYAEVVGPANITVPVDFLVSGSATTSTSYDDEAYVWASLGANAQISACAGGGNCNGPLSSSFGGSYSYSVPTNTPIQIQMQVQGLVGILAGPGATFTATVDPSVVLDPSFNTPGYSVIFSADLSPPPPVPVPAAGWLLLSGIGGLGAFLRGKRLAPESRYAGV